MNGSVQIPLKSAQFSSRICTKTGHSGYFLTVAKEAGEEDGRYCQNFDGVHFHSNEILDFVFD